MRVHGPGGADRQVNVGGRIGNTAGLGAQSSVPSGRTRIGVSGLYSMSLPPPMTT